MNHTGGSRKDEHAQPGPAPCARVGEGGAFALARDASPGRLERYVCVRVCACLRARDRVYVPPFSTSLCVLSSPWSHTQTRAWALRAGWGGGRCCSGLGRFS